MARDMGISINEVFSFLAEDSVIDLELLDNLNKGIKYSIILKLLIFPLFIFVFSKILGFNLNETSAVVLQAGTPSAVSTILMAEAYKTNQKIAATILFTTTLISIITIPILANMINFSQ